MQNSSSTSLTIKWTYLTEGNFQGKPIGYNVSYYSVILKSDISFGIVNFTTNVATLTNLNAYTIYVVRVAAVSSGGIGPAKAIKVRTDAKGMTALEIALDDLTSK